MEAQPIENHGVIGDLHTAALVGMDGSIDFMCFPRFDSPTLFAALLDPEKGGRFQIAPVQADAFRRKQLYFPDTNMLLTRFLSNDGVAEISDFMPIKHLGHCHDLVRRVKVVRGEIALRMVCAPRFDYGRAEHSVREAEERSAVRFQRQGPHGGALARQRPGSDQERATPWRNSSCAPGRARRSSWRRRWRERNRRQPRPITLRSPSRRR